MDAAPDVSMLQSNRHHRSAKLPALLGLGRGPGVLSDPFAFDIITSEICEISDLV
jgi:hypothetical protein